MPSIPERSLPVGTVTFLFTDIEGSTRLLAALGGSISCPARDGTTGSSVDSIARHGGIELGTKGGMPSSRSLARRSMRSPAAAEAQRGAGCDSGIGACDGPSEDGVSTPARDDSAATTTSASTVHRAARIAAAGHGGQVLLSDATGALVARDLPEGVALRDLGEHGSRICRPRSGSGSSTSPASSRSSARSDRWMRGPTICRYRPHN